MKRKTRMWWELGALCAVIIAIIVVGSRPMTVTVTKIDATGPSAQRIDTMANVVASGVIALVVIAILAFLVWLIRNIVRRGTKRAI
jgi:hypothetical protein